MKAQVDTRLTCTDTKGNHYFYVGDPVIVTRATDNATILGTLETIYPDRVMIRRKFSNRAPVEVPVEDLKTVTRDNVKGAVDL